MKANNTTERAAEQVACQGDDSPHGGLALGRCSENDQVVRDGIPRTAKSSHDERGETEHSGALQTERCHDVADTARSENASGIGGCAEPRKGPPYREAGDEGPDVVHRGQGRLLVMVEAQPPVHAGSEGDHWHDDVEPGRGSEQYHADDVK